ncbi:MAG TPA: response regulator transcription factor [Chloroflexota bacterium]|nr:response regulator transcription factor [Chloroflexota bacterium]
MELHQETDRPVRVVVIARQPVARLGWREVLAEASGLLVVGVAGVESTEGIAELLPDAVLAVNGGDDLRAITPLAGELGESGVPVVVVGPLPEISLAGLLRAGVRGVLPDSASPDEVALALVGAARGLLVLSPSLAGIIANGLATPEAQAGEVGVESLTEREAEVLELLALGLANKAIARRLGISEHTVKFHVGSILAKLGAVSRTEAVTVAARKGLLAL